MQRAVQFCGDFICNFYLAAKRPYSQQTLLQKDLHKIVAYWSQSGFLKTDFKSKIEKCFGKKLSETSLAEI